MTPTLYLVLNAPGPDEAWFEGLLRWLVEGSPGAVRTRRLLALNAVLREHPRGPEWRARIRMVWSHTSAVRLLADTGLPAHTAFLREAVHRMVERFVPRLDPEADLSALLDRLGVAAYAAAIVLYVVIGVLALLGGADVLRTEAVLQTILVFLGFNVAWLLLFEGGSQAPAAPSGTIG